MKAAQDGFTIQPWPRIRRLMADGGRMGLRKHTVHGLVEFDVTQARAAIHRHREETGERLSFSAFFLACLGQALDADRQLHAYRNWRNQVIIFDDVDVNMLFEVEVGGRKTIRPHILRGVNHKDVWTLHAEIRAFQAQSDSGRQESRFIDRFVRLPGFARRLFLRYLFTHPHLIKAYYGTVIVSSIGMFGEGGGWGIPVPNHTLQLTLGGISRKPGVVEGRVEIRESLSVTVSFDHDIVDGAPAARFVQHLRELVEAGPGLETAPGPTPSGYVQGKAPPSQS